MYKNDLKNTVDFLDNAKIANWSKGYVKILKDNGYVSGYTDGTFRANNHITRSEAVKMIANISGEILNAKGEYSKNAVGNVVVNTQDITLKNMNIEGDLFLTEGIGEGDVVLENVNIDGSLYIRGGGQNSIIIKNSKINKITIDKKSSPVHVAVEGNTEVNSILSHNNTKLSVNGGTIKVIKALGKSDIKVGKEAVIEKIDVQAKGIDIDSQGYIGLATGKEEFKLNGNIVEKGKEVKAEGNKNTGEKDKDKKPGNNDSTPDPKPDPTPDPKPPTHEEFKITANLNKAKYLIDEDIILTGKLLKDKENLKNIDITVKVIDEATSETINVEQSRTNINGEFKFTFKLPKDTKAGKYKVVVKGNEPANKSIELDFEILEDESIFSVKTDKENYKIDENIVLSVELSKGQSKIENIDITWKLENNNNETIIVGQTKTDKDGKIQVVFKVPKDIKAGKYKLTTKANQPIEKVQEIEITIE